MSIIPKINAEDCALACPKCGGINLSHEAISYYDRTEDEPRTLVVGVSDGNAIVSSEVSKDCDNPSPRRDGMLIYFRCEHCPQPVELAIYQHKGSTFIEWRDQ